MFALIYNKFNMSYDQGHNFSLLTGVTNEDWVKKTLIESTSSSSRTNNYF